MDWFIIPPPPIWLWVGLGVGLAALVVALMYPFLNKPKLRVLFEHSKGYKLWCWIRNTPIENKVLLWMGYERRCREISPLITIEDQEGEVVSCLSYPLTSSDDVRLGIVEFNGKHGGGVFLKDELDKFGSVLKPGLYVVQLELWDKGRCLLKKARRFQVNPQSPFVEWSSPDNGKLFSLKKKGHDGEGETRN